MLFVTDMITDHKLDALSLTATCLKPDLFILNESTPPKITVRKMSHVQKGELLLQFIGIFSVFLRRQALSVTPLK